MQPFIYLLRNVPDINLTQMKILYTEEGLSKSFKYGYADKIVYETIFSIMNDPHYLDTLSFNFNSYDGESITSQAHNIIPTTHFSSLFAELWEIVMVFSFVTEPKTICAIPCTSGTSGSVCSDVVSNVFDAYAKLVKTKTQRKITSDNKTCDMIIFSYADTEIDEIISVQIILNNLFGKLSNLKKGGHMIVQLGGTRTPIMIEIMMLLTSLFEESYYVRPEIIPDLFQKGYLVLRGLKESVPSSSAISKLHLNTENPGYPYTLSLDITDDFSRDIQCINREIISLQYSQYLMSMRYLNMKIYEGNTRDSYIQKQKDNTGQWLMTYSDKKKTDSILPRALDVSTKCQAIRFDDFFND
jgi:hypothetical protein